MIKRISKYVLILVLFTNVCMSQNAFSDALLLEKNSESYLNKLNLILTPKLLDSIKNKPFTARQEYYLRNLKLFIEDPWNKEIKGLDLRIFLEIPQIIDGYSNLSEELKLKLLENEAKLVGLKKVLGEKEAEYKNTDSTDTNKTNDRSELKTDIDNLTKDTSDIRIEITQLIKDTTELSKILKNKTSIDEYKEFKSILNQSKNSISSLGNDNEAQVKETSKESHLSLSQSAIIDALGNAIVEQVKEDLIRLVFDNIFEKKFRVEKCDNKEEEVQGNGYDLKGYDNECDCLVGDTSKCTSLKVELNVLFPNTISLLNKLKSENNEVIFTDISSSLKNTFNDDLKNMLENLTNDKNLSESKIFGKYIKNSEDYSYFKFGVVLTRQLKNGFHPAEMFPLISDFVSKQNKQDSLINPKSNTWQGLVSYFSLINLLQKNLRDVTDNSKNIWINITQLDELKKNEAGDKVKFTSSAEFFLALLYQSDKYNFKFIKEKFYDDKTGFKNTEFDTFKDDLKSFVTMLRTIEQNTNTLMNKSDKNINDYEAYLDNLDSTLSNTNSLLGGYFMNDETVKNIKKKLETIHTYRTHAFDIYKSITNRTYSKILPVVLQMFETQINEIADSDAFKKELIRYTTLYVDITNAKTQDELNSAIYKSVHSSGGFLRKVSEDRFMVTVNSYPGLFIGCESINKEQYKLAPGLSVPIGFTLQFGKYIGMFLQGFDIAAAVSYRISSDNTSTLPEEVTFRQVFSPGLYAAFTFFDFPLSINIGGYLTPALRKIEGSNVTLEESKSFRLGINFSYDVPLWYLF